MEGVGNLNDRLHKLCKVMFVFVIWLSVAAGIATRILGSNLDTANFLSFIDKNRLFSPLQSDYASATNGVMDLISRTPQQVCSVIENVNSYPRNFFSIHAYVFPTLISLTASIFPAPLNWVAGLWVSLSFVGGLLAIYIFLRKVSIPKPAIFSLTATILFYPVLIQAFKGQIYVDLLIFGPACTAVLLLWWMKYHSVSVWKWVIVLLIVLATISERGAYVAGLIGVFYLLLLFGKSLPKNKEALCVLGTGLSAWFWMIIWTTFIQSNTQYQNLSITGSLDRLKQLFRDPLNQQFNIFVMTSISLIVLSFVSGRGFILALAAMAPNLLVSTGGAELSSFNNHYHQSYLAVIVGTAVIGFVRISKFITNSSTSDRRWITNVMGFFILISSMIVWTNFGQKSSVEYLKSQSEYVVLPPLMNDYTSLRVESSYFKSIADYVQKLNPKTVSASEPLMPALYLAHIKDVEYWPIGVGKADVVIAPMSESLPVVYPFGDIWGNGAELFSCTSQILLNEYRLVHQIDSYDIYQIITK